jgi:hypothetical protein
MFQENFETVKVNVFQTFHICLRKVQPHTNYVTNTFMSYKLLVRFYPSHSLGSDRFLHPRTTVTDI